ncbi:Phosphate acetyltransferase [[Mycoplasma] cavipharyngis]|uniref:phosphotransacetylase n=1 Tax=[Mycoplasma] cavipharyngis TaxID=92757 RepID=UPI0037048960
MTFDTFLTEKIQQLLEPRKIILIDGNDPRTQEAAALLVKTKKIIPVLLFENDDFPKDLVGVECVNVFADEKLVQEYVTQYHTLRKGKETIEQAEKMMQSRVNIAMMMLKNQVVDGVVGGLLYPTSDILRGSFKIFGPVANKKTISSVMLMHKDQAKAIFTDISVNPHPNQEQLVEIAQNAIEFNEKIGFATPSKVAMLSYSTKGSAKTESSQLVANATASLQSTYANTAIKVVGEIQFDAAVNQEVRTMKFKEPVFENSANIFVFPDLNAGNIGYKIAQRYGDWGAVGPILVGINGAVNDLSRGATVEDVYYTVLVTALLKN